MELKLSSLASQKAAGSSAKVIIFFRFFSLIDYHSRQILHRKLYIYTQQLDHSQLSKVRPVNKFLSTVVFIMGSICASTGWAEPTINAVTTNWSPFYADNMPNGGPLAEASVESFKRVGYKMEIKFVPWKRALHLVETGKADVLIGAYKTEDRGKFAYYSKSIIGEASAAIIAQKNSAISFDSLEKLKPYRIGILRGTSVNSTFDAAKNFLKIKENNNETQLIKMLEKGRVDLLAGSQQVFFSEYKMLHPDRAPSNHLKSISILSSEAMHNLFSKKISNGKVLRDAFDKGFKMVIEDGTYEKIMKKHGIK